MITFPTFDIRIVKQVFTVYIKILITIFRYIVGIGKKLRNDTTSLFRISGGGGKGRFYVFSLISDEVLKMIFENLSSFYSFNRSISMIALPGSFVNLHCRLTLHLPTD